MARMRYGVAKALEEEADALLKRSLAGVTSHEAKSDILTPWKEQERRRREVFVTSGTPDPAIRRGMYRRAMNPLQTHLNSRDGIAPPMKLGGSLASHVAEHGGGGQGNGDFPEWLIQ